MFDTTLLIISKEEKELVIYPVVMINISKRMTHELSQ